jgi:hypothetical protein
MAWRIDMGRLVRTWFVALFSVLLFVSTASAAVIDFETFNLGGGLFVDTPETLVFTDVNGSGVDVTIDGGVDLRVYDLVQFGGYAFPGPQALIDMNWTSATNAFGTDIVFSSAVSNFTLIAGDFGADDDSPLRIEAFDGGGASLGAATAAWPSSSFPPLAALSLNVTGIRRIHYSSGGAFTGSTFIDNLTFTPSPTVPEPAALLLLGTGIAGVAARVRQRSKLAK